MDAPDRQSRFEAAEEERGSAASRDRAFRFLRPSGALGQHGRLVWPARYRDQAPTLLESEDAPDVLLACRRRPTEAPPTAEWVATRLLGGRLVGLCRARRPLRIAARHMARASRIRGRGIRCSPHRGSRAGRAGSRRRRTHGGGVALDGRGRASLRMRRCCGRNCSASYQSDGCFSHFVSPFFTSYSTRIPCEGFSVWPTPFSAAAGRCASRARRSPPCHRARTPDQACCRNGSY